MLDNGVVEREGGGGGEHGEEYNADGGYEGNEASSLVDDDQNLSPSWSPSHLLFPVSLPTLSRTHLASLPFSYPSVSLPLPFSCSQQLFAPPFALCVHSLVPPLHAYQH